MRFLTIFLLALIGTSSNIYAQSNSVGANYEEVLASKDLLISTLENDRERLRSSVQTLVSIGVIHGSLGALEWWKLTPKIEKLTKAAVGTLDNVGIYGAFSIPEVMDKHPEAYRRYLQLINKRESVLYLRGLTTLGRLLAKAGFIVEVVTMAFTPESLAAQSVAEYYASNLHEFLTLEEEYANSLIQQDLGSGNGTLANAISNAATGLIEYLESDITESGDGV